MSGGYLTVELTQGSQNINGNYTSVTATVCYYGNGLSWNESGTSYGYVTLNGTRYGPYYRSFSTSTSRQALYSVTANVGHNSDGTKTVSASASFNTNVSLGTISASNSKVLTTIPRASTVSAFPSSFTTGSSGTISLTRASSSFTHTATCKIEGVTNNTGLSDTSGIGTSFTYTPPHSVFSNYPTKATLNGEITIQTKNGSTNIGSAIVKKFTINLNSSIKPTSPNIRSSLVLPFGDLILQNRTKIDLNPTSSMSDNSAGGSIVSCSISIENQRTTLVWRSDNHWICDPFSTAGFKTATVTVTDSRGRSATNTRSFLVTSYSLPTSSITYQQNGTNISLFISGTYENIPNNTIHTLDLDYRLQGSTKWTEIAPTQIITENGAWSTTGVFTGNINDSIFEIRAIVSDSAGQSSETSILTGKPLLAFKYGGDDLGVRFTEQEANDIANSLNCTLNQIKLYKDSGIT